jgi:hypothetical protein
VRDQSQLLCEMRGQAQASGRTEGWGGVNLVAEAGEDLAVVT